MARPIKGKTYLGEDGEYHLREVCSIEGCNCIRKLFPLKYKLGEETCYSESKTCNKHRNDGDTFLCNSKPKRKEQIWRAQGIPMSYEKYVELLELNGYCCWLCGKPQSEEDRALNVDHDHKTNKVRGILCRRCNGFIGWLENVTSLDELKSYLCGDFMSLYGDINPDVTP